MELDLEGQFADRAYPILVGNNRVVIGMVKRVHLRDDLFDVEKKRVRGEKLFLIGRMASPNWYCHTRDRFEMIRPKP